MTYYYCNGVQRPVVNEYQHLDAQFAIEVQASALQASALVLPVGLTNASYRI